MRKVDGHGLPQADLPWSSFSLFQRLSLHERAASDSLNTVSFCIWWWHRCPGMQSLHLIAFASCMSCLVHIFTRTSPINTASTRPSLAAKDPCEVLPDLTHSRRFALPEQRTQDQDRSPSSIAPTTSLRLLVKGASWNSQPRRPDGPFSSMRQWPGDR